MKLGHYSKVRRSGNTKQRSSSHPTARVMNIRQQCSFDKEHVFGVTGFSSSTPKVNVKVFDESVPFFIDPCASVYIMDELTCKNVPTSAD